MGDILDFSLEAECIESFLLAVSIWQDGGIVYTNEAALELFELTSEEIHEKDGWINLIHPEDRTIIQEKFKQKLEENTNISTRSHHRLLTKSGNVKSIETYLKTCIYNDHLAILILAIEMRHLPPIFEISSTLAAKLHVAEMVLKALHISYRFVNTHTANLYRRHQEKHEDQIARKYWQEKFHQLSERNR